MRYWYVMRPVVAYVAKVIVIVAASHACLRLLYGPGGLSFVDWSLWALPATALMALPRLVRRLRPRLTAAGSL